MYKRKVIIGILILLISTHLFSAGEQKDKNIVFVDKLFETVEKLMKKNYRKNEKVTERYLFIIDKLEKNEMKISIDNSYPRSIYGGIAFSFYEDDKKTPYIVMSDYFIGLFEKHPSLVMCILFHEFDHAYNYFKQKESFKSANKDFIENYLYEMDAIYLQTMFLRDVVQGDGFSLTKYEQFLLMSLKEDNLRSVSAVFKSADMSIVYDLVEIMYDKISKEEKIDKIRKISSDLISTFPDIKKAKDFEKYYSLVSLLTFENYIPHVLYKIEDIDLKAKKKTGKFSMDNFPEIHKNRNKIAELLKPHLNFISQYQDECRKMFAEF